MKKKKGFTLIELVMVIIVAGILLGVCTQILLQSFAAADLATSMNDLHSESNMTLQKLCDPIKQISTFNPNYFVADMNENGYSEKLSFTAGGFFYSFFTSDKGNLIVYQSGIEAILVDHISNLKFYFYDQLGAFTIDLNKIWYIGISFTLSENEVSQHYNTVCHIRYVS